MAAALILAVFRPSDIVHAYRFAVFAWLSPALGSLVFLLIYRSTGGQWGDALQPFLRAGISLLPWLWLLALPLLWLAPPSPQFGQTGMLRAYLGHAATAVRAVGYAAAFFLFWLAARRDRRVRETGHRDRGAFGPVGLIVLVFVLHLLAVDWLLALEPGWYSTSFPLVWMTGQAVFGLAATVLAALALGLDPKASGAAQRPIGLDWGNLMLTGVIFWSYLSFIQFLIIWNGNLPREVVWYAHRSHGLWLDLLLALLAFYFVLPFLILLSRKWKQRSAVLAGVALSLAVSQLAYLAWMILPSFGDASAATCLLAVALAAAGIGPEFLVFLQVAPAPIAPPTETT
ncbi:hypothetical protein DB347_10085 [Opitutaceae bacterium EW11]|nr:hypothetical protein DB347_10085 [Opitutaceae bacterium EW11]